MKISRGAAEIIETAKSNPHDPEAIEKLVQKHGTAVAAEAIALLAQVIPGNAGVPFRPKAR